MFITLTSPYGSTTLVNINQIHEIRVGESGSVIYTSRMTIEVKESQSEILKLINQVLKGE